MNQPPSHVIPGLTRNLITNYFTMNEGVISARYAKALLKFSQETGNGDKVYAQAGVLALRLEGIRELKDYIQNHDEIPLSKKMELIDAALGEPMSVEIRKFVLLIHSRRRIEYFRRMLLSFIAQYREANNIKVGRLITALPADGLKTKMEDFFHEKTGAEVHIDMDVNPKILGGFVIELDDWRLDASVENRFRIIRRQLIENNNRIV